MSNVQNGSIFQYTYSAEDQEELKQIRIKHIPKEESTIEHLRHLDAQVTQKASMYSLIVGIIGALILKIGMSCCMVWTNSAFVPGIISVIGMAVVTLTYPISNYTFKKERTRNSSSNRYSNEVISSHLPF